MSVKLQSSAGAAVPVNRPPSTSWWTARFLDKPENAFLCAVDESFVRDRFNLIGLEDAIPGFDAAVRHVLGETRTDGGGGAVVDKTSGGHRNACGQEAAAELFYGMAHARYVMTPTGVAKMFEKYLAGCFGHCPRVNCDRSPVLPIGLSDAVGIDTVRIYCPRCMDVYWPPAGLNGSSVDGAYIGTGFPHMAFMTQPELRPARPRGRFAAKLYGFTVHKSAGDLQRLAAAERKGGANSNCVDKTKDGPPRRCGVQQNTAVA
ncbi:Casein kinase II, regulatory subunit, alpha-helical,Casein kinase II, regulatory subunit [Cinara cedri]|uniref:Casein kinase II subunit beta n=1 Tax=Cinara cedri TaxID=506608 RepID=A0A5E4M5F4_9HEMI|nr:Casein kinase II, regulatory subunit, alpha-helical,Casein kinase II, regulatory subunit [Cinara cedri]